MSSRYSTAETDEIVLSTFALDLAQQIVTIARITVRKLRLYRYALLLFGLGTRTPGVSLEP